MSNTSVSLPYKYPSTANSRWSQLSLAIPQKITAEDILSRYGTYTAISSSLQNTVKLRSYNSCTVDKNNSSECPLTTDVHHTSSNYSGVTATWMTSRDNILDGSTVITPAICDAANGATTYTRPYQFTPANNNTGGGGGRTIEGALIASVYSRDAENSRVVYCRIVEDIDAQGRPVYGSRTSAYMLDF